MGHECASRQIDTSDGDSLDASGFDGVEIARLPLLATE